MLKLFIKGKTVRILVFIFIFNLCIAADDDFVVITTENQHSRLTDNKLAQTNDDFVLIEPSQQESSPTFIDYPFRKETFGIICDQTAPIKKVKDGYVQDWNKCLHLIKTDNSIELAKAPLKHLVNKVFFTESFLTKHKIETLVEYIIRISFSEKTSSMINTLLSAGARVKAAYTIYQGSTSEEHLPPIYYAIIRGNYTSFKILWQADKTISMNHAMRLWPTDEPLKKDYTYTVVDFLNHIHTISADPIIYRTKMTLPIPPLKPIIDMIMVTKDAQCSCILQ
jgi:hypothetical protein